MHRDTMMDGNQILPNLLNTLFLAQAQMGAAGDPEGTTSATNEWANFGYGLGVVACIFILPFIISHFVCKAVRMQTHTTKLGVMLATIFAAFIFAYEKNFQPALGPDMRGGTTLVYDIEKPDSGDTIDPGQLATALSGRINPSGTKEISIRPRGESQIEITVPNTDALELQRIKDIITNAGQLEFRIVANSRNHPDIIELAKQQSVSADGKVNRSVTKDGVEVGRWYQVARQEDPVDGIIPLKTPVLGDTIRNHITGEIIERPALLDETYSLEKWMDRENIQDIDVLMAYQFFDVPYTIVNGDDLDSASLEFGKSGYEVRFKLGALGGQKMGSLTGANRPEGDFKSRMAIIMDGAVLSAPNLNSMINTEGIINGNFTKEEVEFLVTILRAGRLPATLSEEPASEDRVGAGLGATTVNKGKTASIYAIIATFTCILLYYRFSGTVASLALAINGLLIFGIMIFIGQPLTLPGLAGLVLTIGMSVDANVLIFERIREEKAKGSAPRMSIRNGFDRAYTTIIDANVTTLIAAIVLYWIGTDQVRGFAVALIIGIATSFFTATFCSRIVFEIAEKLKFASLSMSDGVGFLKKTFLGNTDVDFMGWQKLAFPLSILIITAGLIGVFARGRDLLNIDFTGGTSVTFQLDEPLDAESLRELTKQILVNPEGEEPIQSKLVSVEKPPQDTVYTLVTSIQDEKKLSGMLIDGFKSGGKGLKTYRIKILDTDSLLPAEEQSRAAPSWNSASPVRFVSYQDENDAGETQTSDENATQGSDDTSTAESEVTSDSDISMPDETAVAPSTTQEGDSGEVPDGTEATEKGDLAIGVPTGVSTEVYLEFSGSTDDKPGILEEDKGAAITGFTLKERLVKSAESAGVSVSTPSVLVEPVPLPEGWKLEDVEGFSKWKVSLPTDETSTEKVVDQLKAEMSSEPLWLSLSKIGSKVAGEMRQRAIGAILLSLVFIVAYIWFRFQRVAYGLAAVVALVHDVLITLGVLALCHWLAGPLSFLLIEDFKIGLTEIAAFLTIIGYSLNDTIVVFDRIREVRGRSPILTAKMINESVNQTLSRTLLTSGTTLVTVLLLYVFGGEGIHAFAFALLIGVLVGTYSSIFIAAPVLLWISNREGKKTRAA